MDLLTWPHHQYRHWRTRRSRRAVSFSNEMADLFRQIRGAQLVQQVELGGAWHDSGFVFTDELGNPIDPGRVSKEFARVTKKASMQGFRLHDLRHTHASLLLAANVHPKIVSERLGHASVIITLDIYSHVKPGLQEDAAEKFSRIVADDR